MKKGYKYFLVGVFFLVGCGSKTVTGPQGPQGNPGPNTIQISLQNGVSPTASYFGETDTWIDSGNVGVSQFGTTYRRVKVGATSSNLPSAVYSRVLFQWNISSIPVNATIETAVVELTTQTTTNIGSLPVTLGIHDLNPNLLSGGCTWTTGATWNSYNGTLGWFNCDGDSNGNTQEFGMYLTPALSSYTFTNAFNGVSKVVEYKIPASTVQNWIAGNNGGLILVSEGEFQSVQTANVDFYPYNASTPTNSPQLIVTYE
jgi:hypothetical protein